MKSTVECYRCTKGTDPRKKKKKKKKKKKENREDEILVRIPIFQINEMIGDDGKSQSG